MIMFRTGYLWLGLTHGIPTQSISSAIPSTIIAGTHTDDNDLPSGAQATYQAIHSTVTAPTLNASSIFKTVQSGTTVAITFLMGTSMPTNGAVGPKDSTTSARPTNTQPRNNYLEFCTRRYSNITEVCAHNSPFVRKNDVAANQVIEVTIQLDDGIRMRRLMLA
jgi:hypothetical protein